MVIHSLLDVDMLPDLGFGFTVGRISVDVMPVDMSKEGVDSVCHSLEIPTASKQLSGDDLSRTECLCALNLCAEVLPRPGVLAAARGRR